jgi:hypothetical protein
MSALSRPFAKAAFALTAAAIGLAATVRPASAATVTINDFYAVKQYDPITHIYMGDKIYYSYTATWSTAGYQCHMQLWTYPSFVLTTNLRTEITTTSPTNSSLWISNAPTSRYRMFVDILTQSLPQTKLIPGQDQQCVPQ